MTDIRRLSHEMLAEFEVKGSVDLDRWLARFPDRRDEVLYTASLIEAPGSESRDNAELVWADHQGIAQSAREKFVRESHDKALATKEFEIAAGLPAARAAATRARSQGKANAHIRRAAILTWAFDQVRGDSEKASRYVTHKTVYFLEQALDLQLYTRFRKMAAGPYDPSLRYKDAEPIAEKNGWLERASENFLATPKSGKAAAYAIRYLGDANFARQLISVLMAFEAWDLDTLATVHAAAVELCKKSVSPNVSTIEELLSASAAWKAKRSKRHFGPERIAEALRHLRQLGLLEPPR